MHVRNCRADLDMIFFDLGTFPTPNSCLSSIDEKEIDLPLLGNLTLYNRFDTTYHEHCS